MTRQEARVKRAIRLYATGLSVVLAALGGCGSAPPAVPSTAKTATTASPAPPAAEWTRLTEPTLAEALAGSAYAGFDLTEVLPRRVAPAPSFRGGYSGAFDFRDPASGRPVRKFGAVADYPNAASFTFTEADRSPGSPRSARLLYWKQRDGRARPLAVVYEPGWPADGELRRHEAQLRMLGVELRSFVGWTTHFGALHRTNRADLFIGLEQNGGGSPLDRSVEVIVRVVPDTANDDERRSRGFGTHEAALLSRAYTGGLTPFARVRTWAEQMIAAGKLWELRSKPEIRPWPVGPDGDALLALIHGAMGPLRKAVAAVPAPRAGSADIEGAFASLRPLSEVVSEIGGGAGADLPDDIRVEIARRVSLVIESAERAAAAATVPTERMLFGGLAAYLRKGLAAARASGDVRDLLEYGEKLLLAARDFDAPGLVSRARAFAALRDVADWAYTPAQVSRDLKALTAPRQPVLYGELVVAAQQAERRGLPATAAAHWLLALEAMPERQFWRLMKLPPWPSTPTDDPMGQARRLVAPLYRELVPAFPGEKFVPDLRGAAAPWRLHIDLAAPGVATAAGLIGCNVEPGPLRYEPDFRWASTRVPGKPTMRWVQRTVEPAQTRSAWEAEVAAKRREIERLEADAEPGGALGYTMGGTAAGVRTYRSSDGKVTEFVVDRQNVYLMGVKEAAERQAATMAEAKRKLPLAKWQLAELLKNGPAKAKTSGEYVPDGGREPDTEIRWRHWQGRATRSLAARCPGEPDGAAWLADEVFDAAAHATTSLKHVPAKGFETPDELLAAMARNDQAERPAALAALGVAVMRGRIDAWRARARSLPAADADAEVAWRRWFFLP